MYTVYVVYVLRRVMFIGRGSVLGQWQSEWNYTWEQLKEPPLLTPKGIQILLKVTAYIAARERVVSNRVKIKVLWHGGSWRVIASVEIFLV